MRVNPPKRRRRHRKVRQRDRKRGPKPEQGGHRLNYITTGSGRNVVYWNKVHLDKLRSNPKGLHLRMSTRWIQGRGEQSALSAVELPYIDKLGRYTGCSIYTANMQPASFISTVTSTIYKRIFNYSVGKNGLYATRIRQAQLFRCAAYYALSKNSYFWDRVVAMVKNLAQNYNSLSKIAHKFSCKLDAPTRFVYGHICYQIQWLTFRAVKPRDKSGIKETYFPQVLKEGVKRVGIDHRFEHVWATFNKMVHL